MEVDKAMTHMSSHGAFPADRDRTSVTVEMQHLERTQKKKLYDTLNHPQKKISILTIRDIMGSNDKQSVHNSFYRGKAIPLESSHSYVDKNKIQV